MPYYRIKESLAAAGRCEQLPSFNCLKLCYEADATIKIWGMSGSGCIPFVLEPPTHSRTVSVGLTDGITQQPHSPGKKHKRQGPWVQSRALAPGPQATADQWLWEQHPTPHHTPPRGNGNLQEHLVVASTVNNFSLLHSFTVMPQYFPPQLALVSCN